MDKKEMIQKNQELLQNNPELEKISAEVLEHMMYPRNYGEMSDAHGVGRATCERSKEFALVYIKVEGEMISDISFGCQACQDTSVSGSLFTTMIKGLSVEKALETMEQMKQQIEVAPPKQQLASMMILKAFEGAVLNMENRKTKTDQELVSFEL